MTQAEMQEIDDMAFAMFADAYPRECYAEWPEDFLAYATRKTGKSAEEIKAALTEPEEQA